MRMSRWSLSLLVLVALVPRARAEIIEGVGAVVNGNIIMLSEIEEHAGSALPPGDATGELKVRRDSMIKHAADDLVQEKLVLADCKTQNLEPTATEIDDAIENVQKQNKIDRSTLESAIKAQGLTMPRYRDMLNQQLCRMKIVEMKVRNRVVVKEEDVKEALARDGATTPVTQEVKLGDIYIAAASGADAEDRAKQAKIRLDQGVDFGVVANDAKSAFKSTGGVLGWVKEGQLAPEIDRVATKLPVGGTSDVISTPQGFHILRVLDRRSSQDMDSMAQKREQKQQELMSEKLQKATEDYMAELRRNADIVYRLP